MFFCYTPWLMLCQECIGVVSAIGSAHVVDAEDEHIPILVLLAAHVGFPADWAVHPIALDGAWHQAGAISIRSHVWQSGLSWRRDQCVGPTSSCPWYKAHGLGQAGRVLFLKLPTFVSQRSFLGIEPPYVAFGFAVSVASVEQQPNGFARYGKVFCIPAAPKATG